MDRNLRPEAKDRCYTAYLAQTSFDKQNMARCEINSTDYHKS